MCSQDFTELLEIVYSHKELNRLVVDEVCQFHPKFFLSLDDLGGRPTASR